MKSLEQSESQRAPMSFRERSAWVCSLVTVFFFSFYFAVIWRLLGRGELTPGTAIGGFAGAVIFQIVVLVAAHIVIALQCKQNPKDERDEVIESRAVKNAYVVLAYSCLPVIVCILILAAAPAPRLWDEFVSPAFMSQAVLLCFAAAEAARHLTRALSYRRGA